MTTKLQTLNMRATNLAGKYCELYNNGAKSKELKAAKKAANAAMDAYNLELSKEQYRRWGEMVSPIEEAVRSRFVPNALKIKFKESNDVMGFSIEGFDKYPVSLPMMQIVLGADVFADPTWFGALEKFMWLIANYAVERTSGTLDYQIDAASAEFQFPEEIDPLSDEGAIYALQCVIDKILFIPNPKNDNKNLIQTTVEYDHRGRAYCPAWEVIRESITGRGGDREVRICNTSSFSDLVLVSMNGLLTNASFGCVTDEHLSMHDYEKAHNDSQLEFSTTEAPEAQPIPETHTPAKESTTKKGKATTKKGTTKKGTTKKAEKKSA